MIMDVLTLLPLCVAIAAVILLVRRWLAGHPRTED